MDNNFSKDKILLENIVDRFEKKEKLQYTINGVITKGEYEAILRSIKCYVDSGVKTPVLVDGGGYLSNELTITKDVEVECEDLAPEISVDKDFSDKGGDDAIYNSLNLSVLEGKELLGDYKVGLDFGTAFSKACIVHLEDEEEVILDLPLGLYAGEDSMEMPVSSSLYIKDNKLFFGAIAVEKSEECRNVAGSPLRIDSIKSFLIDENRATLEDSPLDKKYNPTGVEIPKAALLAFYLGYFLYLIRLSAKEKHGVDISYVERRICLPCYKEGHREKVTKELSILFSMGEVLSASFKNEWEDGFEIKDVLNIYSWMKKNICNSSNYIEKYLEESLAVASSRLGVKSKTAGNAFLVIDIGAGTTDFTMYEVFSNAESDSNRAREIKGAEYGVPIAGNKLDTALVKLVLYKSGITRGIKDYQLILTSLRMDVRSYKEALFKNRKLTYKLLNGVSGEILLSDFLKTDDVKKFTSGLKGAIRHVLESIHPSWIKTKIRSKNMNGMLPVILAGGGASLPMLKSLVNGVVNIGGYDVNLRM